MLNRITIKIGSLLCFSLIITMINAQVNIGIGTANPKAALDVTSVTQGILVPRMTGIEVEAIINPGTGELVYSTTDTGSIINKIGFWYYDGTVWRPFGGSSQSSINIYNTDGMLSSNRTLSMAGKTLSLDTGKLTLLPVEQRVGINDNTPDYTLDVNGNVRVRSLTEGNVVALSDGTLAIGPRIAYGTVKESLRINDHNGWYKLNGRSISTLPAAAQSNASAIGLSGNLVDSANRLAKQGAPFVTGGSDTASLTRANLPSLNMTDLTDAVGAHTHSVTASGYTMVPDATGNAYVVRAGRGTASGTQAITLPSAGAHTHTGTINSGGSGTPLSIMPESITYSYFVYLGQ